MNVMFRRSKTSSRFKITRLPLMIAKPVKKGLTIIRHWFDAIEIRDRKLARFLCKVIPVQCPFERDIQFFGRTLAHIPPLCKLNPFYDQLAYLRFRALCYLVEQCGESYQ
ncbi:MAG: nitrogenase [Hydrococcus sp. RU_2_2]|nr:nitrogenase [Hydrococcus sp. RU_2_2]NJP18209.1 nitrogenase [Hydrococcus sp. CRU_1_1]NJQ98723.1 nitrogenase [Hydrococcus sp. CSU_1_8]